MPSERGTGRLSGLDALRGLAALCVLAWHLPEYGAPPVLGRAYLAVDFFFLLSGYVIARCYESRMDALGGGAFLRIRLRRLLPLTALGMIAGALAFADHSAGQTLALLSLGMLLVPVFWGGNVFPLNDPAWSIFFEVVANAAHVLLLRRWHTWHLLAFCGAMWLCLCWLAATHNGLNGGFNAENFAIGFPRVGFSYCLGIVLYRTCRDRSPLQVPAWLTIAALPAAFMLAALQSAWWFDILFISALSPLLLIGGLGLQGGRLGGLVGAISFPIYALHRPVLDAAAEWHLPWPVGAVVVLALATLTLPLGRAMRRPSWVASKRPSGI